MLADDFAPWLTSCQFRRRDAVFRRWREGAWQIIDFQRDKYSDARHVRFTINVGISLDVLQDDPTWQPRGWPLVSQCDLRERAGNLHKGRDHWWSVRPLWPVAGVIQDVLAALETSVRWLDAHVDPKSLVHSALNEDSMANPARVLAIAHLLGEPADIQAAEARFPS